jgi:hypothetical protein
LTGRLAGLVAAIDGRLRVFVSRMERRPVFYRLVLVVLAIGLLVVGLALGETQEILFKGSFL